MQAFVWVMFGLYLVALYSGDADKSYASPLPTWLGLLIDVMVLAMLLYADWYVTATVYALSCLAGVADPDALRVASAVVGKVDLFITTDDRLLKQVRNLQGLKVFFPAEALAYLENWYEH